MDDVARLLRAGFLSIFKPQFRLQSQILVLRRHLNVLRRDAPKRLRLNASDRLLLV